MSEETTNVAATPSSGADSPGQSPSLTLGPDADPASLGAPPLHSEPDRRENAIPHWRVREMVSKAEERVRQDYEQRIRDFERRLAAFEGKAPEPKPETSEPSATPEPSEPAEPRERIDWGALMRESERAREAESTMRERYAREAQIAIRQGEFHNSWNSIRSEHAGILDMPGAPAALKEAALEAWRQGLDPLSAARAAARPFQYQQAQLERARDERRAALRAQAPKGGQSGRGAGAPAAKSTGSIASRITDRIVGSRGY